MGDIGKEEWWLINDDGWQRLMNLQGFIFRGVKFFGAILVFVLTIELCARLDDAIKYGAPLLGEYSYSRLQRRDEDGLPYNLPNARFEKWQHNSFGFRGPEVRQSKSSDIVRVVCVGTSESYGLYESPGKEWPSQLQAILLTSKYEVINASVVGLNLPSFDAYLKKHVLPFDPDIIVLVISPLVYVTTLERAAVEKSSSPRTERKIESRKVSVTRKLMKNIRSLPKIKQICKQALMDNFPGALKKYQVWNTQRQVEEIERFRLNGRKPRNSVPDMYVERFHKELSILVESIRSQGVEVVLSTSPALISYDNISQYPEIFLDHRRFFIEFSLTGMIDTIMKFNLVIAAVAEEHSTMFVDSAALLEKSTEYFGDNVHYTDRGAAVVALALSKPILELSSRPHRQ